MKRFVLTSLFAIMACVDSRLVLAQNGQQPAGQNPDFTLNISLKTHTVKSGSKIAIQIAMTNISDRPMFLQGEIENYGYMVDVTRGGGMAATDTARGLAWKKRQGTLDIVSGPAEPLDPGATEKGQLVISDLYDMSRPGEYSIRVHRGSVHSNTITLTVVP